jgi:xylose isomerase
VPASYFENFAPVVYEGPDSSNPLAYRYYDKNRRVFGKRMEDCLKFAVCYWHNFVWNGSDIFGDPTFARPWNEPGAPMEMAELKTREAFEFMSKLGFPYFTFHDRDLAPAGATWRETSRNLKHMGDVAAMHMQRTGIRLLWGTANLFSHPRYMAGASTNPDPEVFACAAAQVVAALELTHHLGGEAYVLWGGREGYDTLLNTDLKRELDQLARYLHLVVEHKHKIGFKGALLIEPKPKEPTAHQYDFDVASVWAFLQRHGLEHELKVNIEANHATLAGHSFLHEVRYALAAGLFGSIDINRGDLLLGWDTDQYPADVRELMLVLAHVHTEGNFDAGGLNFDVKLRRQSIDPQDMFIGHIGGADALARALVAAEQLVRDARLSELVRTRYARWDSELGKDIVQGKISLAQLAALAESRELAPRPVSGQQELCEQLVARYV